MFDRSKQEAEVQAGDDGIFIWRIRHCFAFEGIWNKARFFFPASAMYVYIVFAYEMGKVVMIIVR